MKVALIQTPFWDIKSPPYFKNLSVNNSPGFCGFAPGCYAHNHPGEKVK